MAAKRKLKKLKLTVEVELPEDVLDDLWRPLGLPANAAPGDVEKAIAKVLAPRGTAELAEWAANKRPPTPTELEVLRLAAIFENRDELPDGEILEAEFGYPPDRADRLARALRRRLKKPLYSELLKRIDAALAANTDDE